MEKTSIINFYTKNVIGQKPKNFNTNLMKYLKGPIAPVIWGD